MLFVLCFERFLRSKLDYNGKVGIYSLWIFFINIVEWNLFFLLLWYGVFDISFFMFCRIFFDIL